MGYDDKTNGTDFTIVTDVLQYGVFATLLFEYTLHGCEPSICLALFVDFYLFDES